MSFLDLPPDLRGRIYALAGLVRPGCTIDLSFWGGRSYQAPDLQRDQQRRERRGCWRRRNGYDARWRVCVCAPLPVALLRVCRRMHDDAVAVLYGQNRFAIRGRTRADCGGGHAQRKPPAPAQQLAPLLVDIPLYGLAYMTSLLVRLNCWPCPLGHEETMLLSRPRVTFMYDGPEGRCKFCGMSSDAADEALSISGKRTWDEAMLAAWDQLCARLGGAMKRQPQPQPQPQLDLTVVCDVDSAEAAERVAAPMTHHLPPRLKSCTMRLGRQTLDAAITVVARDTAAALTGAASAAKTFPFRKLPAELRARILEHTHLGPARLAGYEIWAERVHIVNGQRYNMSGGACCNTCTTTYMDCCCPSFHASVAPRCRCRLLPTQLFRVDRQMYREAALDLFYAHTTLRFYGNRFEQTLAMLRNMTPAALGRIRRLKFEVSDDQLAAWPKEVRHAPGDGCGDPGWAPLVAHINAHMDLPRLSIIVDMSTCVGNYVRICMLDGGFPPLRGPQLRNAYNMHLDLATELCTLKTFGHVKFELGIFKEMAPWLAREVVGAKRLRTS